jgi:hypothetical protein
LTDIPALSSVNIPNLLSTNAVVKVIVTSDKHSLISHNIREWDQY